MRKLSSQDPGLVRWFVFVPDQGRWAIPQGVSDREGYAREIGATRLFHGDQLVWSAPANPTGKSHLAVVR